MQNIHIKTNFVFKYLKNIFYFFAFNYFMVEIAKEHLMNYLINKKIIGNSMSSKKILKKNLENYIKKAVQFEHFSGAVMVVSHGEIILNSNYAINNMHNKQNMIFHVGSITKQFTAAAIMKLWESGEINLQVSINEYLPKEYQSEYWNKVTIHHLLSHTSGIPDYDDAKYYDQKMMGFCFGETVTKIIKEAGQKKLEFEPGSKWGYCNVGYTILGIILEKETGQKYSDIIKNYFLKPLGMNSTSFHEENYIAANNHAKGSRWDKENNKWIEDTEKILTTVPDGGMISTCEDLYKWSTVLEGKRPDLLSQKIVKLMTTAVINTCTPFGDYGYGLYIDNSSGVTRIYHSGWIVGFTSNFSVYPEIELFIALLSNNTTNELRKITLELQNIIFKQYKTIGNAQTPNK